MSESQATIAQILKQGAQTLFSSDSAKLDCEILLLKVLNDSYHTRHTKTWLMTWPEKQLTAQQIQQFSHYLMLRSEGMPVAYIVGEQDFWTLTLSVTPATLIPRPETELLVECALEKMPDPGQQTLLDLGTGSGAIALAIASERSNCHALASDFSQQALAIAQKNAEQLHISNISFCRSHWFKNIPEQQFDVIVSNPPYIAENDPLLEDNVRKYEPLSALHSGAKGLDDIGEIVEHCRRYLKSDGWILFEHGYDQANAVQALLQQFGFSQISTRKDLNYLPRVTMAKNAPKRA
ncbi:MAG: peptide chain release factor N(5)-glutamine methyltransferase [gamma proteobacterium symbiont of Bathyaustriella thionipta]|nr:peptide chain release factor N(5)-glutamine methyltransferase [gamma proteobacterium symbiont of Bathyaustriella thionipta]MCU7949171.1 peptide chain release factor N(5)-glutamine methyltransferase [gamma proteobacterium symbiont of Bathyaustriella thionipta]MCU7954795.1 peptide chain release factor N(5)-glutamine methyltransferase [gamma proteobacterium symbiont of Bathyaustriella thionipta]MCU7956706.1 peptide chain release factor N(5)-glutamine methyltransferase [gamma proteobacterium symb